MVSDYRSLRLGVHTIHRYPPSGLRARLLYPMRIKSRRLTAVIKVHGLPMAQYASSSAQLLADGPRAGSARITGAMLGGRPDNYRKADTSQAGDSRSRPQSAGETPSRALDIRMGCDLSDTRPYMPYAAIRNIQRGNPISCLRIAVLYNGRWRMAGRGVKSTDRIRRYAEEAVTIATSYSAIRGRAHSFGASRRMGRKGGGNSNLRPTVSVR